MIEIYANYDVTLTSKFEVLLWGEPEVYQDLCVWLGDHTVFHMSMPGIEPGLH